MPKAAPAEAPSWVEAFWRDGFAVHEDVLAPDELAPLREAAGDPRVAGGLAGLRADREVAHLLGLTGRQPAFAALARHPRIIAIVSALIGPDIQLQHSKIATKPAAAGRGAYPWHQDFAYFPHTNTSLVAVMVMLDDATPENGCMRMVRGSHRLGQLEHRLRGNFSGGCQESERWADPASIVEITPRAGGISVHHCLTLHGSEATRSGAPRRGVVFQYRADDAFQLADTVFDDTGTLITGRRRGLVRCDPGTVLLPIFPGRDPVFGAAWHQQGPAAHAINPPVEQPSTLVRGFGRQENP
jgi:ectoine hydroxylase-related dioxygenase (phytanoyl-CoA dioxygenase family)